MISQHSKFTFIGPVQRNPTLASGAEFCIVCVSFCRVCVLNSVVCVSYLMHTHPTRLQRKVLCRCDALSKRWTTTSGIKL